MLIQNSKNIIIYRGRYIRRLVGSGWGAECYIVCWIQEPDKTITRSAEIFYGCLQKLFDQIKYDDKFFGDRRWLI